MKKNIFRLLCELATRLNESEFWSLSFALSVSNEKTF